jgi:hypothetical protein
MAGDTSSETHVGSIARSMAVVRTTPHTQIAYGWPVPVPGRRVRHVRVAVTLR